MSSGTCGRLQIKCDVLWSRVWPTQYWRRVELRSPLMAPWVISKLWIIFYRKICKHNKFHLSAYPIIFFPYWVCRILPGGKFFVTCCLGHLCKPSEQWVYLLSVWSRSLLWVPGKKVYQWWLDCMYYSSRKLSSKNLMGLFQKLQSMDSYIHSQI